jgi:hypothetical protein
VSGGFLAFKAAKLAQRLDLRGGMVDGRDLIKRFIRFTGAGADDDYAYMRHSPPWGVLMELLPFLVVFW